MTGKRDGFLFLKCHSLLNSRERKHIPPALVNQCRHLSSLSSTTEVRLWLLERIVSFFLKLLRMGLLYQLEPL